MQSSRAAYLYRQTDIETSDQLRLIILCYEEAIRALKQAKSCYEHGQFAEKAGHLKRGQSVIAELLGSLDQRQGGAIATNLAAIYSYMLRRLSEGDLRRDLRAFDEVVSLLEEMLNAWRQIATDPKLKAALGQRMDGASVRASQGVAV